MDPVVAHSGLRLISVLVIFLCGVGARQDTIAGRVSDPSGRPLGDVRVVSWSAEEVRTDDLGQFKLSRPMELIRFSKEGHQPLTIVTEARMASVVLKPATGASWKPPVCPQSGPSRFGDGMLFATPRGARPHKEADVDYSTVSIRYAGATLVFGTGIYWTYGLPPPTTLRDMITVEERDVPTPWGLAAEYRGRRTDGTRWREVIMFGESIEYDRANAKAAAYFDQVIDSLCFKAVASPERRLQPTAADANKSLAAEPNVSLRSTL